MKTDLSDFSTQIAEYLNEIGQKMTENVENALDDVAKETISELKASSPKDSGDYANSWKEGKKEDGIRRIVNDKTVTWNGKKVSLAKIFKYSTRHKNKHVEHTQKKIRPKLLELIKKSIKKEG